MFLASGEIFCSCSQIIIELSNVIILSELLFHPSNRQLSVNCSKEKMLHRVLANVKSHISRCLNLLLATVTASLWFKWMDDTVSWGDLMLSYFSMMLSHKSLRFCTLDDCQFVLDCSRLRHNIRLPEQSPSNQTLLYRIIHLRNPWLLN